LSTSTIPVSPNSVDIFLNRIYDVADTASEQEIAKLKQGHAVCRVYAKFTTLLADLKWNNEANVSAVKAKVSYEIKDRLVSVLPSVAFSSKTATCL
jgi:hypothetical protein